MAFKVKYAERATDDIEDIIRYISYELGNPQAAKRFYNAVNKKLDLLREHPYMFPLYHNDNLNAEGIRYAHIGNYLIFYRVGDDNSVVNVAGVIY
jgi:toxin ParE1/3/4